MLISSNAGGSLFYGSTKRNLFWAGSFYMGIGCHEDGAPPALLKLTRLKMYPSIFSPASLQFGFQLDDELSDSQAIYIRGADRTFSGAIQADTLDFDATYGAPAIEVQDAVLNFNFQIPLNYYSTTS